MLMLVKMFSEEVPIIMTLIFLLVLQCTETHI